MTRAGALMKRLLKLEKSKYLPSCHMCCCCGGVVRICSAVRGMDSQLMRGEPPSSAG